VKIRLDATPSAFVLKVELQPVLWFKESVRFGTPITNYGYVIPTQLHYLKIFNKDCVIVFALPRGRRGIDRKVHRVAPLWEKRSIHFN
jgi:hypothetical protein